MSFADIFERIRKNRSMMVTRRKNFAEANDSISVLENRIDEASQAISTATFADNLNTVKSKMKENDFSEAHRI